MAQEKGEAVAVATLDYTKREITPYKTLEIDSLDFIPFGSDNLFPQALALYSRLSPNHRGVLTSKNKYMQGAGIVGIDKYAEDWIKSVNKEGEALSSVQKRIWHDENLIGNAWIEFITDTKHTFLFVNHIDSTKARIAKDEETVILHPDWAKDTGTSDKRRIVRAIYPRWMEDPEKKGILRSIYHKKDYEPEFYYYGVPGYISGKDSVQIDFRTNKWNLARLVNSFRLSGMLFVPVKDKIEGEKVISNIEKNYTGEGNQGKLMVVTKSRASEGQKAEEPSLVETKGEDTGSWTDLHKQSLSDIVMAHAWYRSLLSIPDPSGFDTERILNEYNIALTNCILDAQKGYIEIYQKLHREILNKDLQIEFKNVPPLESDVYYTIGELREKKGLKVDWNNPAMHVVILPADKQTTQQAQPKKPEEKKLKKEPEE